MVQSLPYLVNIAAGIGQSLWRGMVKCLAICNWCEKQGIARRRYDSIINKTPISYKANRMIGGAAPSSYLVSLQAHRQVQLDTVGMDILLKSHRIPTAALRADDFDTFYTQRQQNLMSLIEGVMGKHSSSETTLG